MGANRKKTRRQSGTGATRNQVADTYSVGDWADEWITIFCKATPSSVRSYRSYLRLYFTEEFLSKPIQEVTAIEVQKWADRLSLPKEEGGYNLKPKTIRNVAMFMKSVFEKAKDTGFLTMNPFQTVILPQTTMLTEEKNVVTIQERDIPMLKEVLAGAPHENFYLLSMFLGLREMENLGLTMDDIDMENHIIHLRYQLRRDPRPEDVLYGETLHFKALKDKEKRNIPFGEEVAKILQRQIDSERQKKERLGDVWPGKDVLERGDLLFSNDEGSYLSYHTIYDCFKRRVRTVSKLENLRVHDLRHVYAMLALRAGNSLDAIAEHLGHSMAYFYRNVYSYYSREQELRDALAMDSVIQSIA